MVHNCRDRGRNIKFAVGGGDVRGDAIGTRRRSGNLSRHGIVRTAPSPGELQKPSLRGSQPGSAGTRFSSSLTFRAHDPLSPDICPLTSDHVGRTYLSDMGSPKTRRCLVKLTCRTRWSDLHPSLVCRTSMSDLRSGIAKNVSVPGETFVSDKLVRPASVPCLIT
jgi:hypothetical protein